MSISVKNKGNKIIVETDYAGSDVDHSVIQNDHQLIGAMKVFGINEVKGSGDNSDALYSTHKDFDNQFKKKFGDGGYFNP